MQIEEVTSFDPELAASLRGLMSQLSPRAAPATDENVQEILDSPATRLLVARDDGAVVGSLTLVTFREAVELAARAGASRVNLTSTPDRLAANRLYQRLGFEPRTTNVYRLELS